MLANFFAFLSSSVFNFADFIVGLLPHMPLSTSQVEAYMSDSIVMNALSWVNWFLPLDIASSIIGLWGVAMMSYVGVRLAMRFTGELVM